jgi:hypothetical protein
MKKKSKQRNYHQLRKDILSDLEDPRHGTSTIVAWSYNCPCSKCETLRSSIIEDMKVNPNNKLHGTRRGFVYGKCRCAKCRKFFEKEDYEYQREYNWKRIGITGFTWKDFLDMIAKQKNKCALCGGPIDITGEVEHSHATGKIRGIVHHRCNQVIAMIDNKIRIKKVEPELIVKAVNYVTKNSKV